MLTCNSTRSETSLLLTSVKKLKLREKKGQIIIAIFNFDLHFISQNL